MIKMIEGTYGLELPNGVVKPMDRNSGAFKLTKEQEERLVKLGRAKYVEEVAEDATTPDIENEDAPAEDADLDKMNAKELRAFGKEHGLSFGVGISKAEMIAAIREALAEDAEVIEDDEDAPEFDASEAVQ